MRRGLLVGAWALSVAVAVAACGQDCPSLFTSSSSTASSTATASSIAASSSGGVCVPGVQVSCSCPGNRLGAQRCADDASGYGVCFGCGGAGGAGAGTGGALPQGGSGGAPVDAGPDAPVCSDAGCPSWSTDIYAGIFDTNVGCTNATLCHGAPASKGGITLDPGMATAAWATLTAYTLLANPGPARPYIVPCDVAASGMLCNMVVDDGQGGDGNPYKPACGSPMPKGGVHKLTQQQIATIAAWITCGAPEN